MFPKFNPNYIGAPYSILFIIHLSTYQVSIIDKNSITNQISTLIYSLNE